MYDAFTKPAILTLSLLSAWTGGVGAATYYIATDGSDVKGDGTSWKPWATIGHGISKLASGDTLVVRDGVYHGEDNFISDIPSGTAGGYTTIKAENPLGVTIKSEVSLTCYDYMAHLSTLYTRVDGFVFDMEGTKYPPHNISISGDSNKLTRSFVRRAGNIDAYGGWVLVGGSYNLVEDVAGVGAARYGFATGGPTSTASYNIFRRVVGRVDYSNSTQPKATFAVYGNNSGHGVHHVLLQNCIAVDGRRGPTGGEQTYGGFYFPKNASDVTIQGSMVLNNEAA